jgi:hypothetical protein
MATIVKPHTFADLDIIDALKFNNNFDLLYGEFNGNIDNANIKALAAIDGSKLADAPAGVSTAKINNNAVTDAKLSSHASTDSSRAVTTDHIRDSAVTSAKIANNNIILSKVKVAFVDWTPGFILGAASVSYLSTGITTSTGLPLSVEIRGAGAPAGVYTGRGNLQLYLNTSNNTYYFVLANIHDAIGLDTAGFTYRFNYIPVS